MERADRAQVQPALVELARIAQEEIGLGLERQDLLRNRQQLRARARQAHAVAAAVKQLHRAVLFQRADLRGNRRLAQLERARGGAQAAVVGNGHEGAVAGVGHL
ncbi:hypothetical protein D3C72_2175820 [compost metagenome]